MNIKKYTAEELQKELNRRENMAAPQPVEEPDLTKLKEAAAEYIEAVVDGTSVDSDLGHYIYEAAMEAIYGDEVFTWINDNE